MKKFLLYFIFIIMLSGCQDAIEKYNYTEEQKQARYNELKENIIGEWEYGSKQIMFLENGIFKYNKGKRLITTTFEILDFETISIISEKGTENLINVSLYKKDLLYKLAFKKKIFVKNTFKALTDNILNKWVDGDDYIKFSYNGIFEQKIDGKIRNGTFYCINGETINIKFEKETPMDFPIELILEDKSLKLKFQDKVFTKHN